VQQLARLCAPGGKVLMGDLCRGGSSSSEAGARLLQQMNAIYATQDSWTSAQGYKDLLGEAGGT
jgi:hypothetical protein